MLLLNIRLCRDFWRSRGGRAGILGICGGKACIIWVYHIGVFRGMEFIVQYQIELRWVDKILTACHGKSMRTTLSSQVLITGNVSLPCVMA